MLLLDRPKATLTGFHKHVSKVWTDRLPPARIKTEDWLVSHYRDYLETIGRINDPSLPSEAGPYLSHWSDYSHMVKCHWNNEDIQQRLAIKKPKKASLQAWIKKNHPDILTQFKNAA